MGVLFALSELIARDATARALEAEGRLATAVAAAFVDAPAGPSPDQAALLDRTAPLERPLDLDGVAPGAQAWLQPWDAAAPPASPERAAVVAGLPASRAPVRAIVKLDDGARVVATAPVPALRATLYVSRDAEAVWAPARAWRLRLAGFGAALVTLFVAFSLLSVHSVARPIRALTRSIRTSEAGGAALSAEGFGHDEMGELAGALADWQQRVNQSIAEADGSREALRRETEAMTAHLAALRAVSEVSTRVDDMEMLLRVGLDEAARTCGARGGALRLVRGEVARWVTSNLDDDAAQRWLDFVERRSEHLDGVDAPPRPVRVHTPNHGLHGLAIAPHGLRLTLVVTDPDLTRTDAPFWAASVLRHTAMCASHLLLRDVDRERREQQAQYLHRVMKAQEDERSRVARDLHDTVAQDLAALRLEAERLLSHAGGDPELAAQLGNFEERARQMLETVRRILLDLRLSLLESLGFIPASKWLLERMEREHGIQTRLLVDDDSDAPLEYETAIMLFRILQESLLNVTQHAQADRVFVSIRIDKKSVELTVEDDGRGFEPDRTPRIQPETQRGLGILGMEERAHLLGGALTLTSAPGEGTTVHVRARRSSPAGRRRRALTGGIS